MKVYVIMWRKRSMNERREYACLILSVKDTSKLIESEIKLTVNGIESLWKVSEWHKA